MSLFKKQNTERMERRTGPGMNDMKRFWSTSSSHRSDRDAQITELLVQVDSEIRQRRAADERAEALKVSLTAAEQEIALLRRLLARAGCDPNQPSACCPGPSIPWRPQPSVPTSNNAILSWSQSTPAEPYAESPPSSAGSHPARRFSFGSATPSAPHLSSSPSASHVCLPETKKSDEEAGYFFGTGGNGTERLISGKVTYDLARLTIHSHSTGQTSGFSDLQQTCARTFEIATTTDTAPPRAVQTSPDGLRRTINVLVKTLTGKTFAVSALPVNATLAALKEHIEVQEAIPIDQQRLICCGVALEGEDKSLQSFGLVEGSIIHLILRLPKKLVGQVPAGSRGAIGIAPPERRFVF